MHQALLVSDVLLEIFAHLNPGLYSLFHRERMFLCKSAAALARTCKTFYEPAMDLLWADAQGITQFLGCVPRLHPLIYCSNRQPFRSQGVEPLSKPEARQFLRHAARVRSLHLMPHVEEELHLLIVLIGRCAFPRLLSLNCKLSKNYNTRFFHLFLSPTLRHCALPGFHSDLKAIATFGHVLESLLVSTSRAHTADELTLLSDTVRSFKQLMELHCPHLDFAAWKHLSNIPTLLTVRISEYSVYQSMDWDHLYSARFLNLTTLYFCVQTSADVITVMQHSEFPSLKCFTVNVDGVLPWAKAEQLFRALSLCKACETLEDIRICSNYQDCKDPSDMPLTAVRQFLGFSRLRSLQLSLHYTFYLDNDLLLEAMSSWPHIRLLELDDRRFPDRPLPNVTFRGLFAALRICPHLQRLKLSMDAVNIDIDSEAESFQHTSLRMLHVCGSYLEDPYEVARIIFSMLPSVDRIDYRFHTRPLWHKVNELLGEVKAHGPRITQTASTTEEI